MNKLRTFFERVLTLGYIAGGSENNQQEKTIESLLVEYGFVRSCVESVPKEIKFNTIQGLKNNEYISQPCGTQDSPDFIVRSNEKNYYIECKSSKGYKPTYNSGLPKREYIYIFSSKPYDQTTIFRGCDILSENKRSLYEKLLKDYDKLLSTYQDKTEWKRDSRGFDFYMRAMYIQSGGKKSGNDYFIHPERDWCESRVLEMFEND